MATYYIAAAGSASNTGQSTCSPWPLSNVASTVFNPGDKILFNKGDTFAGTTIFTSSGDAGNPITIDLYGTATNNPVLDGGGGTGDSTLTLNGCHYVNVNNLVIQNSFNQWAPFQVNNCDNVSIYNCYINKGYRGMHWLNCGENLKITYCFFSDFSQVNATGDAPGNGGGAGLQLNNCNGGGIEIAYNKFYTVVNPPNASTPGVGDIISIYQSFGLEDSWIMIHDNQIRGGGSNISGGYCGIGLGDTSGSYQAAYNNILCNTGRAGIQIAGGTFINASYNKIYSAETTYSLLGLSVFNTNLAVPTSNITAGNNLINWTDYNGNSDNKWFDPNSTTKPTDWDTNTADGVHDPDVYDELLPDPLFQPGDWNTESTSGGLPVPALPYYSEGGFNILVRNATTGRVELLPDDFTTYVLGGASAHKIDPNNENFVYLPQISSSATVTFPPVVDGKIILVRNLNKSSHEWKISHNPPVLAAGGVHLAQIPKHTISIYIGSIARGAWLKMV